MNQFKCEKCDAQCVVTVHSKSQHSDKKKPDGCLFSIFSLSTDSILAVWEKVPPQSTKEVA